MGCWIKYLLCAIDFYSEYAWVVSLKDKRGISIVNAFQKIILKGGEADAEGRRKPNKIWVDHGGESYNKLLKRFLKRNNIEMYSNTMKENLMLLKDLLEHWKTKILSTW